MISHGNQEVRDGRSKLVQLLWQVVSNSSGGELKVSKKVTAGKKMRVVNDRDGLIDRV